MSEKPTVFNHVTRALPEHPLFKVGSIFLLMLFGVMAAFGVAPNTVVYTGPLNEVVDQIAAPSVQLLVPDTDVHAREIRIRRSDTVPGLLSSVGLDDENALRFLHASQDANVLFRQLVPGKTLAAKVSEIGRASCRERV